MVYTDNLLGNAEHRWRMCNHVICTKAAALYLTMVEGAPEEARVYVCAEHAAEIIFYLEYAAIMKVMLNKKIIK